MDGPYNRVTPWRGGQATAPPCENTEGRGQALAPPQATTMKGRRAQGNRQRQQGGDGGEAGQQRYKAQCQVSC